MQKLLRENISGEKPLSVDPEQAKELAEDLLARVEPIAGAKRNDNCHYHHRSQGGSRADQAPHQTPSVVAFCSNNQAIAGIEMRPIYI
jgi:hypothetical protein